MLHDHAYISLVECVADLLGHGLPVDYIINTSEAFDAVMTISQSVRPQGIGLQAVARSATTNVVCLYNNEWSDGFEPSLSTKANHGSVWIETVTIAPPHDRHHSLSHAYPIAISGETNHEEVEQRFKKP